MPNHGGIEAAKEALKSVSKKPIAKSYYPIFNIDIEQFDF